MFELLIWSRVLKAFLTQILSLIFIYTQNFWLGEVKIVFVENFIIISIERKVFMINFQFQYFKFSYNDNVLAVGKAVSLKDFYDELSNFNSSMEHPKATIFTVDESTFNNLKTTDRIKVI